MKPKILIVDDEERNRVLIDDILYPLNYEILMAEDGEEALTQLSLEPDLILLDVHMPRMGGLEVLRQIRANPRTKDLPVALVTGSSDRDQRLQGTELGADDFIQKPLDPLELTTRVKSLLRLKAYQDEIREHHEILWNLVVAVVSRDGYGTMHPHRLSRYAALIARAVGLATDEGEAIGLACTMCDLGKLGLPDALLQKRDQLTQDEFEQVKQHPTIGARMLSYPESDRPRLTAIVASTHHERYDGSGYPAGLAEEDIPLAGRIAAITDVFEALTNDRPYRPALSNEEALDVIREQRGKHFDPQLVDAFLANSDEVMSIQMQFSDVCYS